MDNNDNDSLQLNHPFMLISHHEDTNTFGMIKKKINTW
jgi:hypothetical protein